MTRHGWGSALLGACLALGASCGGESHGDGDESKRSHPELCDDGNANGNETDIDCGGSDCNACPVLASCKRHDDCASGVCRASTCQAPACSDGTTNGDESDADCGGSCPACPEGARCTSNDDCESRVCQDETCGAASCVDGVLNGRETDVDCGGGECLPCTTGRCTTPDDCESGICDVDRRCANCSDHVKNGAESDVDCGGPDCGDCEIGDVCNSDPDCESRVCAYGEGIDSTCFEAHCRNGVLDGDEGDRDCGGSCPATCEYGQSCRADSDCAFSPDCVDGICIRPCRATEDCAPNGECIEERCWDCMTDTDCGADLTCQNGFCYSAR